MKVTWTTLGRIQQYTAYHNISILEEYIIHKAYIDESKMRSIFFLRLSQIIEDPQNEKKGTSSDFLLLGRRQ